MPNHALVALILAIKVAFITCMRLPVASHTRVFKEDVERGNRLTLMMPQRIVSRWGKHVGKKHQNRFKYNISPALMRTNVSVNDFQKCWAFVAPCMSDEELFHLFKRTGFDQPNMGLYGNINGKMNFIKEIMRRFQVMGGAVRPSCMPAMHVCLLYLQLYFVVLRRVPMYCLLTHRYDSEILYTQLS